MTTLVEALTLTPWRLLAVIGRRRGVRFSSNVAKADLIDRLAQPLLEPYNLAAALRGLDEAERAALDVVLAGGGRLPLRHLRPRYGELRPAGWLYRHRHGDALLSPLERLCTLGLLFYERATGDLFVPDDLIPHLPEPVLPSPPTVAPPAALPTADLVCHDLAVLVGLLQREDVRLVWDRWLPPRFLAAWGEQNRVPLAFPDAGGEKQTARRRFLHYLALRAGWVAACGPYLKPTPAGWLWLEAERAERLGALWAAWTDPEPALWRGFGLPGRDWLGHPAPLLAAVHAGLSEIDPADPAAFAQALVASQPQLYDLVPAGRFDPGETLTETIEALLAGPLVWLGVVSGGDEDGAGYKLTPMGAAWVEERPLPDEQGVVPARFEPVVEVRPDPMDSVLRFRLAGGLPEPGHLAVLLAMSDPRSGADQDDPAAPTFSLTAASFTAALHQGWSAPALLDVLQGLSARPLTGQAKALLRGWAETADRMRVRRLTILEARDPGVIRRLASARRGRALILDTLSPRAVAVDESKLDLLVRRLTRQEGVPPRVDLPPSEPPQGPSELGSGGAAHAWLALRVYQGLSQFLPLPARTPQALLDHLSGLARPADLAAAEAAAQVVLDGLQEVVRGRAPFPAWPEEGVPVEESLALIESALAEGAALEMDYYTAGRDIVTHRVVEPYRVEWRGPSTSSGQGVAYLVGFCRRVQSERVFRLDRIYSVVKVQM